MTRKATATPEPKIKFNYQKHLGNMLDKALEDDTFQGRTAGSDRAVAVAYIRWALFKKAYTIHPGVRNIASFAGVSPTTVSAAAGRLNSLGWLRIIWKSNSFDSKADRVRLMWKSRQFLNHKPSMQAKVFILQQVDVWGGDGLGMNARTVFQVLYKNPDGKRLYEIKGITRLSEKQVRTSLEKLISAGLIKKERLLYINICPSDEPTQRLRVQEIRVKWNIDEKEAAREARFAKQRDFRKQLFDTEDYKAYQRSKYSNSRKIAKKD